MKIIITIIFILIIALAMGCSKGSGDPGNNPQQSPGTTSCDGVNATFTTDILPIFQGSCATSSGCHGTGSNNGPGPLRNFIEIRDAGTEIKRVVNVGSMPKNGSLTNLQIRQISCWVDNGRLNN